MHPFVCERGARRERQTVKREKVVRVKRKGSALGILLSPNVGSPAYNPVRGWGGGGDVKIREEKGVRKETGSGEKRRGRASTRVSSNSRLCRSLQGGLFGEKSGLTRFS